MLNYFFTQKASDSRFWLSSLSLVSTKLFIILWNTLTFVWPHFELSTKMSSKPFWLVSAWLIKLTNRKKEERRRRRIEFKLVRPNLSSLLSSSSSSLVPPVPFPILSLLVEVQEKATSCSSALDPPSQMSPFDPFTGRRRRFRSLIVHFSSFAFSSPLSSSVQAFRSRASIHFLVRLTDPNVNSHSPRHPSKLIVSPI